MPIRFEDEEEVRAGFWSDHPQFTPNERNERQNAQTADVRMAFCDWIDMLARNGEITDELAQDVTL